ncbi:cache domain-containing protein [Thiomicrospira microaerophila]|uniref:cache domain-containing protein n=1 Tax=Thiomicrospira microaerophila TaxID=406020 RepID=UPI00200DD5AC|nr:cache domain-containing protein [Thiomicrospira microaerophila]UQB43222.1 cache domain-containing protein [Thiomicrospira microaerophila]
MQAKENTNLEYLHYLPKVKQYLEQLEEQNTWWTTVAMVGKINSEAFHPQLLTSIVETQKEFQQLRDMMIESLVSRYLNQAESDVKIKTQASIDLIIRNLFERTADVGFLATDEDLIAFMEQANPSAEQQQFINQRLSEYVAKYSVYDDIVLVKPNGQIVIKLNENNTSQHSSDPVIAQALNGQAPYQEFMRATDLFPQNPRSLVYAKRIVLKQGGQHKNLGVLCLSFRFKQEMALIFNKLTAQSSDIQLMLCQQSGEILATNHPEQIAIGTRLEQPKVTDQPINQHNQFSFFTHTQGYEGYFGLPWLAHTRLSNQAAFKEKVLRDSNPFNIKPDSPLYLKQLDRTNVKVSTLLLIVILNGKISSLKQNVEYFLPILDRFQEISQNIASIFEDFIQHIHQVLVETVKDKVSFSALLAADIMDRNLYERANDCRWWALNSNFQKILTQYQQNQQLTEEQRALLEMDLQYINQLYSVYTNILIYSPEGDILAVSNPSQSELVGQKLTQTQDVKRCLELKDTQQYVVSKFEKTPLYNNRPTYIYHAAIKGWQNLQKNLGGIALVFDSEPQFKAMLKDSEPSYLIQEIQQQSFSMIAHPDGTIITSTNPQLEPGLVIQLPKRLIDCAPADNGSLTWKLNNKDYIVGYFVSEGYREYKKTDGYSNPLISLTFTPI